MIDRRYNNVSFIHSGFSVNLETRGIQHFSREHMSPLHYNTENTSIHHTRPITILLPSLETYNLDFAVPFASDRIDVVGKVDAAVVEREAERRLDDTEHIEALADGFIGDRQVDREFVDFLLEDRDFEPHDDVEDVLLARFLDVDVDLKWSDVDLMNVASYGVEGDIPCMMSREEFLELLVPNNINTFVEWPVQDWHQSGRGVGLLDVVVAHDVDRYRKCVRVCWRVVGLVADKVGLI